jgi:nucleoside-triphosphatase
MELEGRLIIISGAIGSGKSTLCSQLAAYFQGAGWQLSGLVSRGVFTDNQKKAIAAVNLNDGEARLLAVYRLQPISDKDGDLPLHWDFDPATLAWGNQVFQQTGLTDLLVVDELGPLEMKRNEGWTAAITAINERRFRLALLVLRPALLTQAVKQWPWAQVITITCVEEIPAVMKEILVDWKIEYF